MTIKAQMPLEDYEAEERLITVCVECGVRPEDLEADEPCPFGERHDFQPRPACTSCGGAGGRWSPDPQWCDACDDCEGVGVRGPWSEIAP